MKKSHRAITRITATLLALVFLAALAVQAAVPTADYLAANEPLTIEAFYTNGVKNPLAVDASPITFSWTLSSTRRGAMQSAYRITLAETLSGKSVWDSQKVTSNQSAGVLYTGKALSSATQYTVTLQVWDDNGRESEKHTATFGVGLAKDDWSASYIWDKEENHNDFAYFRKTFTLSKEIESAIVYTTAHNDYQLYLNGAFVGVGPARSDPYAYGQYYAYDITEQLKQGNNTFAALAHWHGVWSNSGVNAKPAYLLEARICYTDGTSEIIKTDATWKTAETPYIETNPIYFGHYGGEKNRPSINYDATKEIDNWNATAFDDSSWNKATVVNRANFNLYAQLVSEEKENQFLTPLSITKSGNSYLVDFGKCLTGWPKIQLHNNTAGSTVKVQYWEVEKGWGDAGYDTYIAKGGNETFYAPFVRHTSFRFLEITGYQGTLTKEDVIGIVAYSEVELLGSFTSSDTRLNQIYEMSERSGRQNLQQGMISVDANREQSPWTADSWNIGIGMLYNHQNTMIIDKVVKDYAAEQLDNGNFLTCSPARDYQSQMAEWSLYWPMLLWEQYLFSGDTALLKTYYPNFQKFWQYIELYKNTGTGLYNPPGWRASDYAGGSLENGGENIATNSQIYMVLTIASRIAALVAPEDSAKYEASAKALYAAINSHLLVDGKKYKTSTTSGQTHPLGTAWALRAGVVPALFYDRVVEWLALQKKNYDVGGYGGDALYHGLYTAGLGKIATDDFARYDNMLSTNMTNWESFGALSIDNMGNHAWTAYPSYLLQQYVGGISPLSGGFAEVEIKPVIGGLDFAQATVPTIKGLVKSEWTRVSDKKLTLTVTIPANTSAKVYLPDNDMRDLTVSESGKTVYANGKFTAHDGILSATLTDGYLLFETQSGSYSFTVTGTPKNTPEVGEEAPVTGVILDDTDATYKGNWVYETASNHNDRYGSGFRYASASATANATATYTHTVNEGGKYNVYALWGTHPNRATNTPFTITVGGRSQTVLVNQEEKGGQWNLLGSFDVAENGTIQVVIANNANEYVIADAIRIAPYSEETTDSLSPLQLLQLQVYRMHTVCLENASPSAANAFKIALEQAETFCQTGAEDTRILAASEALEAAYQTLLATRLVNLAFEKKITASDQLTASGVWGTEYLTDGYFAKDNNGKVGYTSNHFKTQALTKPITLTLDLESVQSFNQIKLYPRISTKAWNGKTANFPTDYTIEVSNDGKSFTPILSVTDQKDPAFEAVTLNFSQTKARYLRLSVTKLGEYAADENEQGNPTPYRLQLSEIEVWHTAETLSTDNEFGAYLQTREAGDATEDLRIVLIANLAKLAKVNSVDVAITFTLENGSELALPTKKLARENSDYELYQNVTAGDDTYTAKVGFALFGDVITGIPTGAYTAVKVTITESGTENVLMSFVG